MGYETATRTLLKKKNLVGNDMIIGEVMNGVRQFGNKLCQFVWRLLRERLKSQDVPPTVKLSNDLGTFLRK